MTGGKPVVEQASFFAVKQPLTPEALEKIARRPGRPVPLRHLAGRARLPDARGRVAQCPA
ncbi:hypothetical protein LP419_01250 [Massilia sp. H-1]|nr:hypothetical protein LP419_01250 [Massilia sp. H-1]